MSFFNFGKKSKDKSKNTSNDMEKNKRMDEYIISAEKSNNPENAVIAYIIREAKANRVEVAYKGGITYVGFSNPDIVKFLKNWYNLLKLFINGRLDKEVYEAFINAQLEKSIPQNSKIEDKSTDIADITEEKETDFDDFIDFINSEDNA